MKNFWTLHALIGCAQYQLIAKALWMQAKQQ
jgi:hypothetical protein